QSQQRNQKPIATMKSKVNVIFLYMIPFDLGPFEQGNK
ncbi:unnamed protein product, partial [Rotaria sp. Silwood1]